MLLHRFEPIDEQFFLKQPLSATGINVFYWALVPNLLQPDFSLQRQLLLRYPHSESSLIKKLLVSTSQLLL
jgi:hypothetical protein